MTDLENALRSHRFLAGLSDQHIRALAPLAHARAFSVGAWLCRTGDEARSFHLVQSGRVAIEVVTPKRGTARIQTLDAGEIVGWSWGMAPYRWQFDARAVEAVEALTLDAPALRDLCSTNCELGRDIYRRVLEVVSARLTATRLLLLDVYR